MRKWHLQIVKEAAFIEHKTIGLSQLGMHGH